MLHFDSRWGYVKTPYSTGFFHTRCVDSPTIGPRTLHGRPFFGVGKDRVEPIGRLGLQVSENMGV